MYFTFQALLLCFFLAQMANGQENYDPDGMFSALALKMAENGEHYVGGPYPYHPILIAALQYLVIKNGQSNLFRLTSGKTHQNRLM
jgi:hypothetical protein